MDPNLILQGIIAALPGIVTVIHVFTDPNTGETTVTILSNAKATFQGTSDMIAAWNKAHSQTN